MKGIGKAAGLLLLAALAALALGATTASAAKSSNAREADQALEKAMDKLIARDDGPLGAISVIQRGDDRKVHRAGVSEIDGDRPPGGRMFLRIASTAKAMSGATVLSLVAKGVMSLDDTIGERLPGLSPPWNDVNLAQLMRHTSGVPDFTHEEAFGDAVSANPFNPPPPVDLLDTVVGKDLEFTPDTDYAYSNSDNILIGLMVEQATGETYNDQLFSNVIEPLGLGRTSLTSPSLLPDPGTRGYGTPEEKRKDFTDIVDWGGWAWASGGIVSTPANLSKFIRGYIGQELFGAPEREAQFDFFAEGSNSSPPGPGTNSAGLSVFKYETKCGTVYGHTGQIPGYTQFFAASKNGKRSVTFSITEQYPKSLLEALRKAEEKAVCAALAK